VSAQYATRDRFGVDYTHISAYNSPVRRKPGHLLPLELAICTSAVTLRRDGINQFHGYEIAKHLAGANERRLLTAYGTLYRALARLEKMGLLRSRWENPEIPARENRPGRRLYTLTTAGVAAVDEARQASAARGTTRVKRRWLPA
jgi:PadR family transcriptional regulator